MLTPIQTSSKTPLATLISAKPNACGDVSMSFVTRLMICPGFVFGVVVQRELMQVLEHAHPQPLDHVLSGPAHQVELQAGHDGAHEVEPDQHEHQPGEPGDVVGRGELGGMAPVPSVDVANQQLLAEALRAVPTAAALPRSASCTLPPLRSDVKRLVVAGVR